MLRWPVLILAAVTAVWLLSGPSLARADDGPPFVDPVLVPAWHLLIQVDVHNRPLGAELAATRETAGVRIVVGLVPLGGFGQYRPTTRQILVSDAIIDEDPRALAAVLAHELQHVKQGQQGLLDPRDCAMLEASGRWRFRPTSGRS